MGLLRSPRQVAGGAAGGYGVDRLPRGRSKHAARGAEEVAGPCPDLPDPGSQAPARSHRPRSGDRKERRRASSRSTIRTGGSACCVVRGSARSRSPKRSSRVVPRRSAPSARPSSASPNRSAPRMAAIPRFWPSSAGTRPSIRGLAAGGRIQTTDLAEMKALALGPGRELPLPSGPARHRQDLDRRPHRRPPAGPRAARRHRRPEPQGDPQPARRDREGRAVQGVRFRGLKKSTAGNDESEYNGHFITSDPDNATFARRALTFSSSPAPPGSSHGRTWTAPSTTS